ncbi:MAG TPA: PAS domain S-box protein, partial [Methanocella sp.]|nr:PAS domain S-box protein [Methanocella sp.]
MNRYAEISVNTAESKCEEDFYARLKQLRARLSGSGDSQASAEGSEGACLKPEESDLSKAQRLARIGYWTWHVRSGELDCSEETVRIFSGTTGKLKSFDMLLSYVHPEDRELFLQDISMALFGETAYTSDYRVMDATGTVRLIHSAGEVTKNIDGEPFTMFGMMQDITGPENMANTYPETEESIKEIIYAITDSIEKSVEDPMNAITESMILMTPDGFIITINEVAAKRLGGTPDSMIGTNCYDYMPTDVSARRRSFVDDVVRMKLPLRCEDVRDDTVFDQTIYPIISSAGNVNRVAIFAADITEKRKAELALLESEEKLRSLITQSQDGIMLIDASGTILEFNHGYEEITGISRESILGKHVWDLQYSILWEKEKSESDFQRLIEDGKAWIGNLLDREYTAPSSMYIRRHDGRIRAIESSSFRVRTNKQPLIGTITRDVTDQKMAESALRESLNEKDMLLKEIHH